MKRLLAVGVCLAFMVPALASAQTYTVSKYWGAHPNSPSAGGGFCYQQGSHHHPNAVDPAIAHLFRAYNGHYTFVGNVYHFGYKQQAYPYYGHHPLPARFGYTYCYLDGAHHHQFMPPRRAASYFLVHNGYYYYNGPRSAGYYNYRNRYYKSYNTYRYLPQYQRYYNRHRTYARTYSRPATVRYYPNTYAGRHRVNVYRTSPSYGRQTTYRSGGARVTVYRTPGRTASRPTYRYNYQRRSYPSRNRTY